MHRMRFVPLGVSVLILAWVTVALAADTPIIVPENVSQLNLVLSFSGHTGYVRDVAFSPDGLILASSGDDRTVRLWSILTGDLVHVFDSQGSAAFINSLAFSPDGGRLACPQGVWTLDSMMSVLRFSDDVAHVAFSPDGKVLAVDAIVQPIKLYDTTTWTVIMTFESQQHIHWTADDSFGFEFSPDGAILAAGTLNAGNTRLWRVDTGTLDRTLSISGPGTDIHDVSFSSDGKLLAAGGQGLEVLLLRVEDWGLERALPVGEGTMSLDFSPDGRLLAVSCEGVVSLWDVQTGNRLRVLHHNNPVLPVAFSRDGCLIACGLHGGEVVIWGIRE